MCRSKHPFPADERAATVVSIPIPGILDRHDVGVRAERSMVAVDDSLVERFTQTSGCQAEQEKHGKRGHLVSGISVTGKDNCEDFLTPFYTCRPRPSDIVPGKSPDATSLSFSSVNTRVNRIPLFDISNVHQVFKEIITQSIHRFGFRETNFQKPEAMYSKTTQQ